LAISEGDNNDSFGETVDEGQGLGLSSRGEALALEIHGVTGTGFGGGVGGEKTVS
jgi:hypothetical protein